MKKLARRFITAVGVIIIVLALATIVLLIKKSIVDNRINNDFNSIYTNKKFINPVSVTGIEVFKQEISCGYACIEMIAKWQEKSITEKSLLDSNDGKISSAMFDGFAKEMNKQFPEYKTTEYRHLTNTELIDKVYDSLSNGMPVPFQLTALYTDENIQAWTFHYALMTGMDIKNDSITVLNPYGYKENYTVDEFLKATRYASYENMEFYFKLAIAAELFNNNTIYIIE